MAEWLCRGLQILVQRFDSASGLHRSPVLLPDQGLRPSLSPPCPDQGPKVGKIRALTRAVNIASAIPGLIHSLHRQRSERRLKAKTWVPFALTMEGATHHFSISESTFKRW